MSDVLKPGQTFASRYRIEKFLAKGGFGAVYIAEQIETELRVALKVLWPHVLFSKDAVSKFKLEARIAGRVGSEHIVRVFDSGFDEDSRMPFLVMELLAGEELQRKVEREGALHAEKVVTYVRQIASALDKAHGYVDREGARSPIVHRDLKPENLFLTNRESGDPIVKILDFGIAKILSDSAQMSQEVKGTPLYMAFEQASAGQITPQTDIWALGLITFFLLTGHCYWKAGNSESASLTQLFGEVLSLPIDPPSTRARELGAHVVPSPEFDRWFSRCVNRDPAERFKTAGECSAALASALLGAPATQPSGGAVAAVEATSASGGLSGTAIEPTQRAAELQPAATTAESIALGQTKAPETQKRGSVVLGLAVAAAFVVGGAFTAVAMRDGSKIEPIGSASSGAQGARPPEQPTSPPPPPPDPIASTIPSAPPPQSSTSASIEQPVPSSRPASTGGRTGTRPQAKPTGSGGRSSTPQPSAAPSAKRSAGVYGDR